MSSPRALPPRRAPRPSSMQAPRRSISSPRAGRSPIARPDVAVRGGRTRLPILGIVLPSGSVVARGTTPVVDASRGRNDPRKTTLGRRAWSGLEVSPAPYGRGCESTVGGIASGRRRTPPQASVGSKTRSAGREHARSGNRGAGARGVSAVRRERSPRGRGDRRWS
jgi:hypothetical protein